MIQRFARVLVPMSALSLLFGCGHSTQYVPKASQVAPSTHIRHIRDLPTIGGIPVIGGSTSRNSFNSIYGAAGMGGSPVEMVIDLGSIHDRTFPDFVPPECSDPDIDSCAVPSCTPGDADCSPKFDIARVTPAPGVNCFGSPGALANNLPFGATDKAHTIVDIYVLGQASLGNGFSRVGWVYIMGNYTDAYLQDSGDNSSYFQNALMNVPVLGPVFTTVANTTKGAFVYMTFSQAQALIQDYKARRGASAGSCFTRPLYT